MTKKSRPRSKRTTGAVNIVLQITSTTKNLARVESLIQEVTKAMQLDDGTLYRLQVAVTEAVNNAIIHGNGSDPEKLVKIKCQSDGRCLKFQVTDQGKGFDAASLPNPLEEKNLLKEHGRGVFLMKTLMDSVSYRTLKHGSVVTMKLCLDR